MRMHDEEKEGAGGARGRSRTFNMVRACCRPHLSPISRSLPLVWGERDILGAHRGIGLLAFGGKGGLFQMLHPPSRRHC